MIDRGLLGAYLRTDFVVQCLDGEIVMRPGQPSQLLDDLLLSRRAEECAFITAWNPGSVNLDKAENNKRQAELVFEVEGRGFAFLPGYGVGDDKHWEPEESILIIGISREEATGLAIRFGQIAIVPNDAGNLLSL